jgi:hypothetical protein
MKDNVTYLNNMERNNMNYELSKQLKDAGFPIQDGCIAEERHNSWVSPEGNFSYWNSGDEDVYVPTLEELIEACGEDFPLRLQSSYKRNDLYWQADNWGHFTPNTRDIVSETGKTPQEAVAKLWLALNPIQKTENKV